MTYRYAIWSVVHITSNLKGTPLNCINNWASFSDHSIRIQGWNDEMYALFLFGSVQGQTCSSVSQLCQSFGLLFQYHDIIYISNIHINTCGTALILHMSILTI